MKLFVLFFILITYSVKQRVSVSLFCQYNYLIRKQPSRRKSVKGKNPVRGEEPKFSTPRVGVLRGE